MVLFLSRYKRGKIMSESNINAYCKICGKGYHVCNTCKTQKTFKAWRSVTDTIDHFLIYSAIHNYTVSKNKELAKTELEKCDLTDMENFKPEIKSVIKEIMQASSKVELDNSKTAAKQKEKNKSIEETINE